MKNLAKIYVNGKLIGFHEKPLELREKFINMRRQGKIANGISISYDDFTNEIYVNTEGGRLLRPVIVVKRGRSLLTNELKEKVLKGEISWEELVKKGVIEYLDTEEEENALIALDEKELTNKHTHLEIDGLGLLGLMAGMIPFVEHNQPYRSAQGAKMFKQGLGIPGTNHCLRTDTESYLLWYPQKTIVKTKITDALKIDERPFMQNFVVAIIPYYGYNALDALVISRGAVQRGLGRASYFRTYSVGEYHYPGGQRDKFEIPDESVEGYLGEELYSKLGEDGLAEPETKVEEGEAMIGRTSPPKFIEEITEFGVIKEKRIDNSVTVPKGKSGFVDKVFITEGPNGERLVKVRIRSDKIPEIGDKFSSRHGQKGVVGLVVPDEDMPFNEQGIRPDLIINPHAIPSRMTLGHVLEMLVGLLGTEKGEIIDGSAFQENSYEKFGEMIEKIGYRKDGKQVFYDGITGEKFEGLVFQGIISYRRLYHIVSNKLQYRAKGPVQLLTRQPTEGKAKEGGLRLGEMEVEAFIGHGASLLLYEKMVEDSDKVRLYFCEKCGLVAIKDRIRGKIYCEACKSNKVVPISTNYSFKLLLQVLLSMGIYPKVKVGEVV